MAYQISQTSDTAANWASNNPVLQQGQIGCTTDTLIFKIGDGSTAWNSLADAPTAAPSQTVAWRCLGDGGDGSLNLTSATYTGGPLTSGALTRDAYYSSLTISGTGTINTAGFMLFVSGILDLTNATTAGAINNNGAAGSAASGATGGGAGTAVANGSIAGCLAGSAGATATSGAGTGGIGGSAGNNGGSTNASGAGGSGADAGGAAAAAEACTNPLWTRGWDTTFLRGVTIQKAGSSGSGGSSGGGDGTNVGGGGGAGGNGGGGIAIYANIIVRSANTSPGTIQAIGGTGGTGGNGNTSGGAVTGGRLLLRGRSGIRGE